MANADIQSTGALPHSLLLPAGSLLPQTAHEVPLGMRPPTKGYLPPDTEGRLPHCLAMGSDGGKHRQTQPPLGDVSAPNRYQEACPDAELPRGDHNANLST